jgi:hypothetical protein
VPASAPTSTVAPDQPVAQKDKATDAAWWDESKQPPSGPKPQ